MRKETTQRFRASCWIRFLGSGTTIAESLRLGRRGVGIDLSEKYLTDNAVPRITGPLLDSPATAHLVPRKSFLSKRIATTEGAPDGV